MNVYLSDLVSFLFLLAGLYLFLKKQIILNIEVGSPGNNSIVKNAFFSKTIVLEGTFVRVTSILLIVSAACGYMFLEHSSYLFSI